jgi:signal transduction histidine kinase/ActR/RegA family two-component response regulator
VTAWTDAAAVDRRVIVVTPTSRDADITRWLLSDAGIEVETCASLDGLLDELERGAATILIPEELVTTEPAARLVEVIENQPQWSDLPVLVLARPGANSRVAGDAVRTLGNVTLLERPLRASTLLSAVRTALRARERQLQIRGHLAERAQAEASLRQADQRKDEFLATLGHELRNPLAPLLTGLQLLKATGADGPHFPKVMDVMERQIDHLVRLVDDLLEVSRITRGLVEIHRDPIDLAVVVRSAIETSRPLVEAAGHELIVDVPAESLTVGGDAVRLTQVFANLITNAAKYTNAGGRIWVTVTRDGDRADVSVRDNGIGIPSAHLASVFDMFMQVDRSSRRAQGGLGIGLTLVRSLVEMHGGTVLARSAGSGAGSEFVVGLPVRRVPAVSPHPPAPLPRFPPRRVLLVDDNRDAADTLGALLASLGATTMVVSSGAEALAALPSFQPHVVLLDIGMPEMDGYQAARQIRASPAGRGVLLIALTGWGQDQDHRQSEAAGFDHHLVKPPDIDRLRTLICEHQFDQPAALQAVPASRRRATGP